MNHAVSGDFECKPLFDQYKSCMIGMCCSCHVFVSRLALGSEGCVRKLILHNTTLKGVSLQPFFDLVVNIDYNIHIVFIAFICERTVTNDLTFTKWFVFDHIKSLNERYCKE